MKPLAVQNLACPLDGEPLLLKDKQLICHNGHTFDIARQGYINLLPVQYKRSKEPGDSKEMVLARSQFLDSGVYEPIAKYISTLLLSQIDETDSAYILDAGCGEGYYLNYAYKQLTESENGKEISLIGLDVSKPAIIEAAKRNKSIIWLVGTNRQPPVIEKSIDVIVCVFGFPNLEGFDKVLKPGGKVILVEPGQNHLLELRDVIYKETKVPKMDDTSSFKSSMFSLRNSYDLKFTISITDKAMIHNLLLMTPHFYRANKSGREAGLSLESLDLTIDVKFQVFVKEKLPADEGDSDI